MGLLTGDFLYSPILDYSNFTLNASEWYWIYCGADYQNNNIYFAVSSKEKYFELNILNIAIRNYIEQTPIASSSLYVGVNSNQAFGQNYDLRSFKYYNSMVYKTVSEISYLLTKEICINFIFLI